MTDFDIHREEETPFEQVLAQLQDESSSFPAQMLYRFSGLEGAFLSNLKATWPKLSELRKRGLLEDLELFAEGNSVMDFDAVGAIGLSDEDAEIREIALRTLWQTDDERYLPEILTIIQSDESAKVRAQAAAVLGRFVFLGELGRIRKSLLEKASAALFSIMDNEDIEKVRQRALESLGFSSDSRVAGLIEDAYDFGDEDWQASALFAMGRSVDERWVPSIMESLEHPNSEINREAARAAGELEIDEAIPLLISLLHDDVADVRLSATWALSQIGGEVASDALEEYLSRADDEDEIDLIEDALENLAFNLELDELHILDFSQEDLEALNKPEENDFPSENLE